MKIATEEMAVNDTPPPAVDVNGGRPRPRNVLWWRTPPLSTVMMRRRRRRMRGIMTIGERETSSTAVDVDASVTTNREDGSH